MEEGREGFPRGENKLLGVNLSMMCERGSWDWSTLNRGVVAGRP